ncbi:hypothetical protein LC724_07180 [Blautia sp. RD014234]|nr:hypothetical protein [Blautia parvula]
MQIANKGKSSCFIRCRLLMDDEEILPYLHLGIDSENWEKSEDGYYYYKSALEMGEITTELLRQITVSEGAPEELLKRGFSLSVYAESYQQGQFLKDAWQEAWKHFDRNKKQGKRRGMYEKKEISSAVVHLPTVCRIESSGPCPGRKGRRSGKSQGEGGYQA